MKHATMLKSKHEQKPWLKMKDSTKCLFKRFLIQELPRSWIEASISSRMVACKVVWPRFKQLITWSQHQRVGIESALGQAIILSQQIQQQQQTSHSQTWISKKMLSSEGLADWTPIWLGHLLMLKPQLQNHLLYQSPLSQLAKFPPVGEARLLQTMCHLLNDPLCRA